MPLRLQPRLKHRLATATELSPPRIWQSHGPTRFCRQAVTLRVAVSKYPTAKAGLGEAGIMVPALVAALTDHFALKMRQSHFKSGVIPSGLWSYAGIR